MPGVAEWDPLSIHAELAGGLEASLEACLEVYREVPFRILVLLPPLRPLAFQPRSYVVALAPRVELGIFSLASRGVLGVWL